MEILAITIVAPSWERSVLFLKKTTRERRFTPREPALHTISSVNRGTFMSPFKNGYPVQGLTFAMPAVEYPGRRTLLDYRRET